MCWCCLSKVIKSIPCFCAACQIWCVFETQCRAVWTCQQRRSCNWHCERWQCEADTTKWIATVLSSLYFVWLCLWRCKCCHLYSKFSIAAVCQLRKRSSVVFEPGFPEPEHPGNPDIFQTKNLGLSWPETQVVGLGSEKLSSECLKMWESGVILHVQRHFRWTQLSFTFHNIRSLPSSRFSPLEMKREYEYDFDHIYKILLPSGISHYAMAPFLFYIRCAVLRSPSICLSVTQMNFIQTAEESSNFFSAKCSFF